MANETTQFDEQELEQYGVWVKAGSEEVAAADGEDGEPTFADLPTDEAPIVPATQPDDAFDLGEIDASGVGVAEPDGTVLEEFEIDELDSDDPDGIGATSSNDDDELDLDLPDLEDIVLEEAIDPTAEDVPDIPAVEEETTPPAVGAGGESDDESAMISLEDLDIDEPDDDPDPFEALSNDESDRSTGTDAQATEIDLDQLNEAADVDAQLPSSDESIPGSDSEIDDLGLDDITIDADEDLPELEENEHDFTPENQAIAIIPEGPATTISEEEAQFLNDNEGTGDAATVDPNAVAQIQSELSEIRHELADLKRALREGRGAGPLTIPQPDATQEHDTPVGGAPQAPPTAETGPGPGFFDEDEDETIALTGDELDNILNTAEFTEETGEAAEVDEDLIAALEPDTSQGASVAPQPEAAADSIDLEPVESAPFVVEGDESAVDELANMSIDQELADIEQLSDESGTESEFESVELDMDTIEAIEATADTDEAPADTVISDDLETDDLAVDSDFDSFADAVERELDVEVPSKPIQELELEHAEPTTDLATPEPAPDDADFVNEPSVPVGDGTSIGELPERLKDEIRSVLSYMDQLLDTLPDDKIEEFAQSEHFAVYKRMFEELGLES